MGKLEVVCGTGASLRPPHSGGGYRTDGDACRAAVIVGLIFMSPGCSSASHLDPGGGDPVGVAPLDVVLAPGRVRSRHVIGEVGAPNGQLGRGDHRQRVAQLVTPGQPALAAPVDAAVAVLQRWMVGTDGVAAFAVAAQV